MSDITFICRHCQQQLSIEDAAQGTDVKCPACQGELIVPMLHRRRSSWTWVILTTFVIAIIGGVAGWYLKRGEIDAPYTGPLPSVDFEVNGVKVATSIPFYGRVNFMEGSIVQPPGPEGFEFGFEDGSMVWNVRVGVLVLVNCKISVREADPRLEMISLVRGNQIISPIEGLGQPAFEAASAKDLNDGLATIFKQGKTPTADLVFRVRDKEMIKREPLFVEVRWKDSNGNILSGKYSLARVLRRDETSPAKKANPPPPIRLVEGERVGQHGDRLAVPNGTFLRKDPTDTLPPPGGLVQGIVVDRNPFTGVLEMPFLRLIPAGQSNWIYEIRAVGGTKPNQGTERRTENVLRLHVQKAAMKALALNHTRGVLCVSDTTMDSDPGITWLKQPYEIANDKGDVVFTSATE